ncbi:ferrous iron transport protein B [uncultured Methanobrevibacter sp.]|uniref:ferrous iron transport protein B n=1 Tax=uncultured Methanobrevibacter sp. TaxID=253161 RepID=UPI0025DACFAC|nr:ferrous iron transport protein B [uncultured Methanobrevibacter sp.]
MVNLKVGLAGNPNVGKTTVFNELTGMHQHVGNWPGKTVEQAIGQFSRGKYDYEIVDLPGNYALSAHTMEEIVSRDFIVDEDPDVIIDVVDASNLERNLYLTVQMMELGANLVLALNMNDFAKKRGYLIDVDLMSEILGFPVIDINAKTGQGIEELFASVEKQAENPVDTSKSLTYDAELKSHFVNLQSLIEKDEKLLDVPSQWTAIKLLENDSIVIQKVQNSPQSSAIFKELDNVLKNLNENYDESPEEIIAGARYEFIDDVMAKSVEINAVEGKTLTDKIDDIVLNKFLAFPIFVVLMYIIFEITYNVSAPFQNLIEQCFNMLSEFLASFITNPYLTSFLCDAVIGGVGGVLSFLPIILVIFLFLSILEDCGYLARAAFSMDLIMHKLVGLHGKAFIPMILGFGCGVPAIMATRTLENDNDRKIAMMLVPFMSCTARLPIYAIFIAAFFQEYNGIILLSIYLLGIIVAFIVASILKRILLKGVTTPFVMELPSYKLPSLKGVLLHTGEKVVGFIKKAGTVILGCSIVLWALSSFPLGVKYGSADSLLGMIGSFIAPIFAPLGFGTWQAAVALIAGLAAKEVIVSTFGTLGGMNEDDENGMTHLIQDTFTPLSAYSFMAFTLLYIPCFSTIAAIKHEMNGYRWALTMCAITFVTAYVVSFLIYNIGLLAGFG